MLQRGVLFVVVIAIVGLVAPHVCVWLVSIFVDAGARKRIELESLIETQLNLFGMRHGLEELLEPDELFGRYAQNFADRASVFVASPLLGDTAVWWCSSLVVPRVDRKGVPR